MIELVRTMEPQLIARLVQLETETFGMGGLNVWFLEPLVRHGRVYVYRLDNEIVGLVHYMLDWDHPQKAYMVGVSISKESHYKHDEYGEGEGRLVMKLNLANSAE